MLLSQLSSSSLVYMWMRITHMRTSKSVEIKFCLSTPSPSQHVHGYVRAREHSYDYSGACKHAFTHAHIERERDDEIQRSKFFPFTHHHTQERETRFVHYLVQRCTDWIDNIVIYVIYLVHLGLWFMIFPKLFVVVVSIMKVHISFLSIKKFILNFRCRSNWNNYWKCSYTSTYFINWSI